MITIRKKSFGAKKSYQFKIKKLITKSKKYIDSDSYTGRIFVGNSVSFFH